VKQFLIVYRRQTGELLKLQDLDADRARALESRAEEERHWRDDPEVEVVVLGANSLEELRRTHGRYFKAVGELARELGELLPN
jgi:hypothetical protein